MTSKKRGRGTARQAPTKTTWKRGKSCSAAPCHSDIAELQLPEDDTHDGAEGQGLADEVVEEIATPQVVYGHGEEELVLAAIATATNTAAIADKGCRLFRLHGEPG